MIVKCSKCPKEFHGNPDKLFQAGWGWNTCPEHKDLKKERDRLVSK
jgi:hypothetical protein